MSEEANHKSIKVNFNDSVNIKEDCKEIHEKLNILLGKVTDSYFEDDYDHLISTLKNSINEFKKYM